MWGLLGHWSIVQDDDEDSEGQTVRDWCLTGHTWRCSLSPTLWKLRDTTTLFLDSPAAGDPRDTSVPHEEHSRRPEFGTGFCGKRARARSAHVTVWIGVLEPAAEP